MHESNFKVLWKPSVNAYPFMFYAASIKKIGGTPCLQGTECNYRLWGLHCTHACVCSSEKQWQMHRGQGAVIVMPCRKLAFLKHSPGFVCTVLAPWVSLAFSAQHTRGVNYGSNAMIWFDLHVCTFKLKHCFEDNIEYYDLREPEFHLFVNGSQCSIAPKNRLSILTSLTWWTALHTI